MNVALIIATIVILAYICYMFLQKKKSVKTNILVAMCIGVIALTILVFPLLEYADVNVKFANSFFFAVKSIGLNQDLDVLSKLDLGTFSGIYYFVLMNILFIALPLLTVSILLTFLSDVFGKLKFKTIRNKDIYVFTEVNEKAILLANELSTKTKSAIIFTNVKEDDEISIKSIRTSQSATDLKFQKRSNKIIFYMISKNEEKNLNESLELIDKYKDKENITIYVVNNTEEAPTILDSTDKGDITVEIVNENERAIYNLLNNTPLFLNSHNDVISVLIIGCGQVGKEFLKDSICSGMMIGHKLKITVIDIIADKIKENISTEAPELLSNYDVNFVNADIKSNKAIDVIKSTSDINYVLVSMENDNKNLDTAIFMRQLFLKYFETKPVINIWIQNEYKKEQVNRLVNEKAMSYEINAFGSIKDMYYDNRIIDSELERLAKQIHLSYCPEDTKFKMYNSSEYNKKSSRASALHIRYKFYSILKDQYLEDLNESQNRIKKIYSNEHEEELARNEHDRWNAYMRGNGYTLASIEDVKKYYPNQKKTVNYLAKLHPALVSYDELDDVSNKLSEIKGSKVDLKNSDIEIVRTICNDLKL